MKICSSIVICLLIYIPSFSQTAKDTIHVFNYPVKNGFVYLHREEFGCCADRRLGVSIYSRGEDVFSVNKGLVKKIFTIDDSDNMLVRSKDTFLVYCNITKIAKKVGDTIYKGDLLGKIMKEPSDDTYELFFMVLEGRKGISYEDHLKFFKRIGQQ